MRNCLTAWEILGGADVCGIDVTESETASSRTRFEAVGGVVILGCDAYPGLGTDARSRMSMPACLAHEMAHAERHFKGILRPFGMPDYFLEEVEASIHASFVVGLSGTERAILIEDARDQLEGWRRHHEASI